MIFLYDALLWIHIIFKFSQINERKAAVQVTIYLKLNIYKDLYLRQSVLAF